jgi:hypothetical protein
MFGSVSDERIAPYGKGNIGDWTRWTVYMAAACRHLDTGKRTFGGNGMRLFRLQAIR